MAQHRYRDIVNVITQWENVNQNQLRHTAQDKILVKIIENDKNLWEFGKNETLINY
jgi:hypothetical protein